MAEANGTAPDEVQAVQAAAEGVKLTGRVEFRGRPFRLGTGAATALMPMLEFAGAAANGIGTGDPAGLAAMREMIRGCFILRPACGTCEACEAENYDGCPQFDPGDWPRFTRLATAVQADGDELMKVVEQAMEQITARPTLPPSGSSPPGPAASANSRGSSSSPGRVPDAFRAAEAAGDLISIDSVLRSPS